MGFSFVFPTMFKQCAFVPSVSLCPFCVAVAGGSWVRTFTGDLRDGSMPSLVWTVDPFRAGVKVLTWGGWLGEVR